MFQEFKKFALRGNVVDLAVAVIIGGAFGKIVSSLVSDVTMPLIGVLIGGVSFTGLAVQVGDAVIGYGAFIQSVVDFLIIAIAVFLIVKAASTRQKREQAAPAAPPAPSREEVLLAEIRDLLRARV